MNRSDEEFWVDLMLAAIIMGAALVGLTLAVSP